MNTSAASGRPIRDPALLGQTVVVIGGTAGIGLATARHARAEGADIVLAARDPQRLADVATELGAVHTAAFDATDASQLAEFFNRLPTSCDHVMVTAGQPHYGSLIDADVASTQLAPDEHLTLVLGVAQHAVGRVLPGGALLFMSGTGGRRPGIGRGVVSTVTAALTALARNLALELAPIRVNLIAAGFVDTDLSAALLGNDLDARRDQLRATLPIGRVVGPDDVAALAVHLMTNSAITGATYDVDGGQQLLSGG